MTALTSHCGPSQPCRGHVCEKETLKGHSACQALGGPGVVATDKGGCSLGFEGVASPGQRPSPTSGQDPQGRGSQNPKRSRGGSAYLVKKATGPLRTEPSPGREESVSGVVRVTVQRGGGSARRLRSRKKSHILPLRTQAEEERETGLFVHRSFSEYF